MEIIYPVVVVHIIFLIILFYTLKQKHQLDKLLLLWLIIFGVQFLFFGLFYFNVRVNPILLQTLGISVVFLHGPMLYLITRTYYGQKTNLFHFLPFVLVLFFTGFAFMIDPGQGITTESLSIYWEVIDVMKILSGFVYIVLSALIIIKAENSNFTSILPGKLCAGLVTVWIISGSNHLLTDFEFLSADYTNFIIFTVIGLFVFYLGFQFVLKFIHRDLKVAVVSDHNLSDWGKYRKSTLNEATIRGYQEVLEAAIKRDRLYLNHGLTLHDLSSLTGIQVHNISQTLSQGFGMSFYHFINKYRVREFINRVNHDPGSAKLTLEALAKECGFKSKSSFNKHFKINTGLNPSQYIRKRGN